MSCQNIADLGTFPSIFVEFEKSLTSIKMCIAGLKNKIHLTDLQKSVLIFFFSHLLSRPETGSVLVYPDVFDCVRAHGLLSYKHLLGALSPTERAQQRMRII